MREKPTKWSEDRSVIEAPGAGARRETRESRLPHVIRSDRKRIALLVEDSNCNTHNRA